MQKHTKSHVKVNFKKDAFISDVCHRCLCVMSNTSFVEGQSLFIGACMVHTTGVRLRSIFSVKLKALAKVEKKGE